MVTLPGDLSSPTAGPILSRRMEVLSHGGSTGICAGNLRDGYADVFYDEIGGRSSPLSCLSIPVEPNADTLSRWLARHHGLAVGATAPGWRRTESGWELSVGTGRPEECAYFTATQPDRLAAAYIRAAGIIVVQVDREPDDPAEALALACLHAAGRLP